MNNSQIENSKFSVPSGIVLVNKPVGISSNAVVNIVKHNLGVKKCGHLGTLDLEGEGLLPVTVNSATRLFEYFLHKDKTYQADFEFGFETDTLDLSGKIIKEKPCNLTIEQIEQVCKSMLGKQLQMPPMFSAKKVNGKIAYKEAIKGNTLDLKPKEIEIYDLKLLKNLGNNIFRFEISCSSGTYIRCVCRDMAEKLSTYGTMRNILRTRCGDFLLKDSFSLEEIKEGHFDIIPCEKLFGFQKIVLDKEQTLKILNGQHISNVATCIKNLNDKFKIYGILTDFDKDKKSFLGIGVFENNKLKLDIRLI